MQNRVSLFIGTEGSVRSVHLVAVWPAPTNPASIRHTESETHLTQCSWTHPEADRTQLATLHYIPTLDGTKAQSIPGHRFHGYTAVGVCFL